MTKVWETRSHKVALPFGFNGPEAKSESESGWGKPGLSTDGSRPRGRAWACGPAAFPKQKQEGLCEPVPGAFPLHSTSQIIRTGSKRRYAYVLTSVSGFGTWFCPPLPPVNSSSHYSYRNEPFQSKFSNATQHFVLFFPWPIYASFNAQHHWHPYRTNNTQSHIAFFC